MPRQFFIDVSSPGPTATLRFHPAKLVYDEIDELPGLVADLISDGRKAIILNLAGLELAGNRPLGALLRAYTTCRGAGVRLILCAVQDRVLEILRITKLDRAFELFESEAAALRALSTPGL